ncbi:MAG: hypothetical protein RL095_3392 [Verrucomicrobiota bacterium]|jgi:ribonuclease-3
MHPLSELEDRLGHRFVRRELLLQALRHPSWVNEHPKDGLQDNQRLEFLGDAVLQLALSEWLYALYPQAQEGELTRTRASLVREESLALLAAELKLGAHLSLGRSEDHAAGRSRPSTLADAFEAILAAISLDAGADAARRIAVELVSRRWPDPAAKEASDNPKGRLQELLGGEGKRPVYELIERSGEEHRPVFRVGVKLGNQLLGEGAGSSRRAAEQVAAAAALQKLGADGSLPG